MKAVPGLFHSNFSANFLLKGVVITRSLETTYFGALSDTTNGCLKAV